MNSHLRPRGAAGAALRPFTLLVLLVSAAFAAEDEKPDDSKGEVPLSCAGGWRASLLIDNGDTGIWTVKAFQVFPQYACPEVIGLDDMGRCWILVSYSGKWTPLPAIEEKEWLGGLAHGDVDPRAPVTSCTPAASSATSTRCAPTPPARRTTG